MRDVKQLVWGIYILAGASAIYLFFFIGAGFLRQRRTYFEVLSRRVLCSAGFTLIIVVGVGLFALVGFDTLFLKFHQLSFANDFWQLDPRTDFLVMLFPQDFWFDATMWVALRTIVATLIISALSGGYLVYLRKRGQERSGKVISPL